MLYRENGQFKTSYRADQQIFPIAQDALPSACHHPRGGLPGGTSDFASDSHLPRS